MVELTRRAALLSAAAAAACTTRASLPALAAGPGLGDLAAEKGIAYGSMVTWKSWDGDHALNQHSAFPDLVDRECTLIVSAMEMFWGLNSKSTGSFDYSDADSIVDWAHDHKKMVRGHNLVWHEQTPKWFKSISDRAEAEKRLTEHVRKMCSRFAGRMHSWDVVNEAIFPNDEKPGSLRESVFYKLMGPEYLDLAFSAARAADPKALLVYNEYNLECDIDFHEKRRRAIIELLDGFKQRGTPIDAIGIQSHLWNETFPKFNPQIFASFLQEVADRGVQIMLTELDVVDNGLPSDIGVRDAEVATMYKTYLDVALANPAVKTVVTWGLSDRDSWITHLSMDEFRRSDGLPPRPLPFDADLNPKPAYSAIAEAFKAAPKR